MRFVPAAGGWLKWRHGKIWSAHEREDRDEGLYNPITTLGRLKTKNSRKSERNADPTLNDAARTSRRGEPVEIHGWASIWWCFPAVMYPWAAKRRSAARRKDLIAAARLNVPRSDTVGRGMKVNKEEMLGMLVALDLYVKKSHEQERVVQQARRDDSEKCDRGARGQGGDLRA